MAVPLTFASDASASAPTCQAISGHVRDVYGTALTGVSVAAQSSACGSSGATTTDSAGAYSIQIDASVIGGVGATASRAGYGAATKKLMVVATSGANDFTLQFDLQSSVQPAFVRAGQPVTVSARTTAPPTTAPSGYACTVGANSNGDLGNGSTTSSSTPVAVSGLGGSASLSGVSAIAANTFHKLALRVDGTVMAWGYNGDGTLGNGNTTDSSTPVVVSGVGGSGSLTGVTAISAGGFTAMALRSDGTVVDWGRNPEDELGNGTTADSSTPVVVSGVGGSGSLTGVTAIAAGYDFSLALRSDGTVVAWGYNGDAALGDGTTNPSSTPVVVSGVGGSGSLTGVTAISAGGYFGMALRSDGTVVAWGDDGYGELGVGIPVVESPTPVVVSGVGGSGSLTGVTAISAGGYSGMALRSDRTVVDWGQNNYGQLGNGTTTNSWAPVVVSGVGGSGSLTGVTAISAGGSTGMALLSSGMVVDWGQNNGGQLGNGTTANSSTPVTVSRVGGTGWLLGVIAIAADDDGGAFLTSGTCPDTTTMKVIGQLPPSASSAVLALAQGSTDAYGYTSWTGSWTPPAGTPDGTYTIKVCVVGSTFTGNCDAWAQQEQSQSNPLGILSGADSFIEDNTAPRLVSSSARPFSDMTSIGSLTITWTDNLSGVDPNSVSLSVDGTTVTPSLSVGGLSETLSWDASGLSAGVHQISTQAADNAGNVAPAVSFPITIGSLTAGPATASKAGLTVINSDPSGAAVGPRTVTFHEVQVQVGSFSESLGASTWVGHGSVGRPVTFGPFQVTFKDSTGALSQSSSAVSVSVVVPHVVATVSPSAGTLDAQIPATTYTLPDFTVSVPTAFPNAPGSTATLPVLSGSLGSPVPLDAAGHVTNQLLSSTFSSGQQIDILGGLTACMARDAAGNNVTTAKCSANPSPTATVYVNGQQLASLLQPVSGPADMSLNHSDAPTCVGTGGCVGLTGSPTTSYVDSAYSSLSLGCGPYTISVQTGVGATYNLCTGLPMTGEGSQFAGAYVNAWVFKDNTSGHYHLWQQDHVDPGSIAACPNGLSASGGSPGLTSGVYRAAANTVALDQATGANIGGSFKKNADNPQTLSVSLGTTTQADYQSNETAGAVSATNNTVDYTISSPSLSPQSLGAGQGFYQVLPGQTVDALGNLLSSPSSTANQWTADTTNPLAYTSTATPDTTTSLQLITGSDFATPAPSGGYVYSAQLPFQLAVTYGCA